MEDAKNLFLRRAFLASLAVLITTLLVSCSFAPNVNLCTQIDGAPVKQLTSSQQNTVLEDPGTIIVYHGSGCAESNKSGGQDFIKVEQSLGIPQYATNATVFLNGWHLKYLHSDHHVAGLGTLIRNIQLDGGTLKWEAAGVLSDDNFDDPYNWCYYYTVVAWNSSKVNLTIDHKDGTCDPRDHRESNFFITDNTGTTTALSSFPRFLHNPDFASSKAVAILPRGFGFAWSGGDDHHLLQVGYNLDHSEVFVENGKKYKNGYYGDITPLPVPSPAPTSSTSQVDSGFVSWETYAIFKDDDTRRDYTFGEIVSGLGGSDVGVIQPPFSILPEEGIGFFGACLSGPSGIQTQEFVIQNVPYKYAIPMLTGWELGYGCMGDQHVTEVGIWIDEMHYDKTPDTPGGTLRYKLSSILRDEDNNPGFDFAHKVTVLGLKPVSGGIQSDKLPDLVPFSPFGTSLNAFCRIEQGGKLLRVTVKNQGNADAGPSKTTVTFVNKPFTLDTPPIPAGGSVDLLFKVPSGCFNPDCSFKITVDSSNQVDELNNEGNNTANGGCIG
jgi:hypothetical protein